MALVPVIFGVGLITFLLIVGWSSLGVAANLVVIGLLAFGTLMLVRLMRKEGLAGGDGPGSGGEPPRRDD